MTIVRGLILSAAVALTAPAFAQTPEQANFVAAQALIEADGVGDVFEAIQDDSIAVRHTASRLTCHFYDGQTTQRLIIFSGQVRGDDVGCASEREDNATTVYATRYTPPITLQQALADAEAGIRNRFADARPTPALLHMTSDDLPTPLVNHFLISLRDEQWLTSVLVAQSGDWIIKVRFTQRAIDEDALRRAQLEGNAIMMHALLGIHGEPG